MLDGSGAFAHGAGHEPRFCNLRHLPRDYSLAIHRWLRLSILTIETETTPGQQADWRCFDF